MKKLLIAVLSVALLSGAASFANAKDNQRDDFKKAIEEMDTLVEKYNKASDKKKPGIEKQIKEKVAVGYDKHLKRMEERTAQLEEKVAKMKKEIEEMKTTEAKTKQVDKITKEILSGKKPKMFNPPWDKDGKFGKPGFGPKGKKGFKHHDKKGCKCQEKGECGCKDGKEAKGCSRHEEEGACPFSKEGGPVIHEIDNLPPQPMPDQI